MKDFIFSTTRQWNCGDEFILLGTINILKKVEKDFNSIIYNRNPDIRPIGLSKGLRNLKLKRGYTNNKDLCYLTSYLRIGFHDNSIKYNSDLSCVDMAVFAGSPETFGHRNYNFFEHIVKNNIPLMALGIGWFGNVQEFEKKIYERALFVSVRDEQLLEHEFLKKINAVYLPCPALQSVPFEKEKKVESVKNIALGIGAKLEDSVINACVDDGTYNFSVNLYRYLIEHYSKKYKFSIVCHYVDEVSLAHKIFDKYGVDILYSFDSKDYIDIYKNFDFVISPRVHACGISSSLGIPNINISHDHRAGTCKGFLSDFINLNTSLKDCIKIFEKNINEIKIKSENILSHKHSVLEQYVKLISAKLNYNKINYQLDYKSIPYLPAVTNVNNTDLLTNFEFVKKNQFNYLNKVFKVLGIPVVKIVKNNNIFKILLFSRLPFLKIIKSSVLKIYLFNIQIIRIK